MARWIWVFFGRQEPLSDYKRVIVYAFSLILLVVGHQFVKHLPIEIFRSVRWSVISMLCILCLCGAGILMTRIEGNRAKLLFTIVLLLSGLTNLLSIIKGVTTGYAGVVEYRFLALPMLVYGSVFAYFFLLYPIEALRPGWLNFRRAILLFMPNVVIPILFLLMEKLSSVPAPNIDSTVSLYREIFAYNAWVPLLILAYPVFGLVVMMRHRKSYRQWCENNYASIENVDVKWLDDYIFSNLLITISALALVFSNDVRSVLAHNVLGLIFFIYAFYRVLIHQSAYPQGFFKAGMDEESALAFEEMSFHDPCHGVDAQEDFCSKGRDLIVSNQFVSKLPDYKAKLEQWMMSEKPYLQKDFKLTDAMEILPLNRSYLSRLFNEGYGETFYHFVMRYRIAESKLLLLSRPDFTLTKVADLSGFSSLSVFSRAFAQEMNCTPSQWRRREVVDCCQL